VFQAERHTTRSQYRLTLTNFTRAPSTCTDMCGDGVVSSREVCDQGALNGLGDGSPYGGCAADCTLEPFCGDGIVQAQYGEVCDDGINLGGSASSCSPGCKSLGARCGDGVVQTQNGEQCDDGNTVSGDGCSSTCQFEIN
jgi:cysteine-rich repeat protein